MKITFPAIVSLWVAGLAHAQQPAAAPTLTDLKTSPTGSALEAGLKFTFTLKGSDFNTSNSRVLFSGPNCNPCVVPTELLAFIRDKNNQVVALTGTANVSRDGEFTVAVQNGAGPASNGLTLKINPASSQQGVKGAGASPISFNVDKEFCSYRSGYKYDASPAHQGSTTSAIPGDLLVGVTDRIPNLATFIDSGKNILSPDSETKLQPDGSDTSRLLVRAFGAGACDEGSKTTADTNFRLLDISYYVVNIVWWKKAKTPANAPSGDQQPYQIATNDWYLFNIKDGSAERQKLIHGKFSPGVGTSTRIYGSTSVGFLGVHLRGDISQDDFENLQISYNVTVKQATPINVQHLEQLISVITGLNLGGGAKAPVHAPGAPTPDIVIGLYGGGQLANIGRLPDDITFTASIKFPQNPANPPAIAAAQPAPASFNNTYHNEGLQHWDVSVGVPVNSIKELDYSSTDGVVTNKQVSRYNAYGLFDIYPWAVDISNPPAFSYPHAVVGLPIAGKVFNKPFLGAGGVVGFQSLPWIGKYLDTAIPIRINFYGGLVYNKEFQPTTLKTGQTASGGAVANDLHGHRVWKGQFGIEFSIKDVASKLTSTSKTSSATGAKGSS